MNWRTPLARTVFWVGGQIMRIKYPQKTYRWIPPEEREERGITLDDVRSWTEPSQRRWLPHPWGTWLAFHLASRIDPAHYEHWALVHTPDCSMGPCPVCRGEVCGEDFLDDDEMGAPHRFGGGV